MYGMDYNKVIRDYLREELRLFDKYLREAVENNNPRISRLVGHIFGASGKYLRPILVLLSAKSCGKITPEAYHGAVTVELVHTASLVHDDVVDEAEMRRSQPSVNAVFDNTRSVLLGDYLLSSALRESVKTRDWVIINFLAGLGRNLVEGELNQYAIATEIIIDENEYFDVIDKKTASLMHACAVIGAKTAGADERTVSQFGNLGQALGVAFQIKDDIFDYFSDDIGKPIGNDIREGKITLPLIYALRNAPEDETKQMLEIIHARNYSVENIKKLFDFAKEKGGIDYAYGKIDECIVVAQQVVDEFDFENDKVKEMMNLLLMYSRDRRY
jgi:octaprenyl-diphosphate synthase